MTSEKMNLLVSEMKVTLKDFEAREKGRDNKQNSFLTFNIFLKVLVLKITHLGRCLVGKRTEAEFK